MTDFIPQVSIQDEVMSFLLSAPSIQAIADFRASEAAQQRLEYLLDASREGLTTEAERIELADASLMDHFMIRLKAKARQALRTA